MRFKDKERILWVDSVCINQADYDERADQVSLMRKIYSPGAAVQVLVWLGEEGTSSFAFEEYEKHRGENQLDHFHHLYETQSKFWNQCQQEMESLFALFIVVEDDPEHFEDLYDEHLLSRRSDGPHLFCRRSDDGHLVCQRSVFEDYGRDLCRILEGISSVFEEGEDRLYDGSGSLAWEEKFDNFLNNLSGFPDFSAESITRLCQKNSALVTEITYLVRLSEAYNELFVKRQW